jgi:hypothetical protein
MNFEFKWFWFTVFPFLRFVNPDHLKLSIITSFNKSKLTTETRKRSDISGPGSWPAGLGQQSDGTLSTERSRKMLQDQKVFEHIRQQVLNPGLQLHVTIRVKNWMR